MYTWVLLNHVQQFMVFNHSKAHSQNAVFLLQGFLFLSNKKKNCFHKIQICRATVENTFIGTFAFQLQYIQLLADVKKNKCGL